MPHRVLRGGRLYILHFPPTTKQRRAAGNRFCQSHGFAQAGTFTVSG
jgi:hypothetical protein